MDLRDGFREITDGWMLVDDHDELTDRIERIAAWAKVNGPLTADETATAALMVATQVARGVRDGQFATYITGG